MPDRRAAPRQTQAKIERAIRAWQASGLGIGAIEVTRDGTVRILAAPPAPVQPAAEDEGGNSCDGLFGQAAGQGRAAGRAR